MHDNDERTIKKINESLDFLDSSLEVKKPDFMKFVQLVNEVEERTEREKGKNLQFLTFLLSAVLIVAMEIFAFSRSMATFIVIQAFAISLILPVLIKQLKGRKRQVPGQ